MYTPTVADRIMGSAALRRRQGLARAIGHSLADIEVHGSDNVPATGPVVLAMNHRAFVDGPLVFGFVRRPVTCLVKVEAFTPRMSSVLYGAGQLPIHRDRVDAGPVRMCLRILGGGGVVGIFPEGARGDGRVASAKPGVAYLAMRSGAPVVPIAFHGSDLIAHTRRPRVRIVIGEPIQVEQVDPHARLNRRVVAAEAERLRAVLADLVAGSTPRTAVAA